MWDVDGLLAAMSSRQIAEWMAYAGMEPFGGELIDVHFAKLDAIMSSTKDKPQDPKKFRLWKQVEEKKDFDPQEWFESLKSVSVKRT